MSDQAISNYLSGHPFFSGLDEKSIEFLSASAITRKIEGRQVLFRQGTRSDKFYLLRSGRVSVEVPALVGPVLQIQNLGEDEILGWSWLIPPYQWHFQARVEENSEIIEFDGSVILERCERDPKFGYELFKRFAGLMSERLDAARQKMIDEWNPPGFA